MRGSALLLALILASFVSQPAVAEDSVPALAQAIAELSPDRTVLELPEVTYTIGSMWTITRQGLTIRGAGIGKTVFRCDPKFTNIMVHIKGANTTITDLTLDGNGTPRVIFLDGPGVVADTIEVKNFAHIGIGVPGSPLGCRIANCIISGLCRPSSAIWHDAGPNPTRSTLMIDHNTITASGIYCTGGTVSILNNQVSGNACNARGGGGQIDVGNAFTQNTVAVISGNTIINGWGPQAGGIELGGGNFTISNNTIRNHGASGITLGHNVTKAVITGNVISNSGHYVVDRNKPQARAGIYVLHGPTNLNISGNRCFDDQSVKTQTWGIILQALLAHPDPRFPARATEHVRISNNDLRRNIHPEGLLEQSGARDRIVAANLPAQANR